MADEKQPDPQRAFTAKAAAFEQAMALLSDSFPAMLRRYYENMVEAGFPEGHALYLTVEAQKSMFAGVFNRSPGEGQAG